MMTNKKDFIPQCLKIFENVLTEELPEGDFYEFELIEKAYDIIYKKIRHIKLKGG